MPSSPSSLGCAATFLKPSQAWRRWTARTKTIKTHISSLPRYEQEGKKSHTEGNHYELKSMFSYESIEFKQFCSDGAVGSQDRQADSSPRLASRWNSNRAVSRPGGPRQDTNSSGGSSVMDCVTYGCAKHLVVAAMGVQGGGGGHVCVHPSTLRVLNVIRHRQKVINHHG